MWPVSLADHNIYSLTKCFSSGKSLGRTSWPSSTFESSSTLPNRARSHRPPCPRRTRALASGGTAWTSIQLLKSKTLQIRSP